MASNTTDIMNLDNANLYEFSSSNFLFPFLYTIFFFYVYFEKEKKE